MGEFRCRVCGLDQAEPIRGDDGRTPSFDICACCGCEFGYEDETSGSVEAHRKKWLEGGAKWFNESRRPPHWDLEAQLRHAART